jgi:hypothetical protein
MKACSQYNSIKNKCMSGHAKIHQVCRGFGVGCPTCGNAGSKPPCMREDTPSHLMTGDGHPLGWKVEASQ